MMYNESLTKRYLNQHKNIMIVKDKLKRRLYKTRTHSMQKKIQKIGYDTNDSVKINLQSDNPGLKKEKNKRNNRTRMELLKYREQKVVEMITRMFRNIERKEGITEWNIFS